MRLAIWNLNRCRPNTARAHRLQQGINQVNADVWVLTETSVEFSPGPEFCLLAHSANAPDRDAKQGECWVAIWSRVGGDCVQLTADLERAAAVKIDDCVVVGTVLPWLSDRRDPRLTGGALFQARLSEQAKDWQRLQAKGAICVAGDFNQDLLLTGHYYGSKNGRAALKETLSSCNLNCLTGSEDDPLADGLGQANIDHICVHEMLPLQSPPSSAWPSVGQLIGLTDHYCIYTDIGQI